MEKMLFLGGNCWATRKMIDYAKKEKIYTIVTDFYPVEKSLAKSYADENWSISIADIDTLEKKCRQEHITSICCGLGEFNIEKCLELCEKLNLPFYCTKEAWHYSRDKLDFKKACEDVGAPVPKNYYITDDFLDADLDKIEYPVVVKPVDMHSNVGVSFCNNKKELIEAYNYVRSVSNNRKIVIEKMCNGEEWYCLYAIADGEISLLGLNGMYSENGTPKNRYVISTSVSKGINKFIKDINPKIEKVLHRVGCTNGYAWVELMNDDDDFYIIEMGYRMDGQMIFIPYKDLCGCDIVQLIVDASRGIIHKKDDLPTPQTKPFTKCACSYTFFTKSKGTITKIIGIDKYINNSKYYMEKNYIIGKEIDEGSLIGSITFSANDCNEMCDIINDLNNNIQILDENGNDMLTKYTNFDSLKSIYINSISTLN